MLQQNWHIGMILLHFIGCVLVLFLNGWLNNSILFHTCFRKTTFLFQKTFNLPYKIFLILSPFLSAWFFRFVIIPSQQEESWWDILFWTTRSFRSGIFIYLFYYLFIFWGVYLKNVYHVILITYLTCLQVTDTPGLLDRHDGN